MEELIGTVNEQEIAEFRSRNNRPQRTRESIFKGWTQDAYNCWESKSDCSRCSINLNYNLKNKCLMKTSINELIRVYGLPTKSEYKEGAFKNDYRCYN